MLNTKQFLPPKRVQFFSVFIVEDGEDRQVTPAIPSESSTIPDPLLQRRCTKQNLIISLFH